MKALECIHHTTLFIQNHIAAERASQLHQCMLDGSPIHTNASPAMELHPYLFNGPSPAAIEDQTHHLLLDSTSTALPLESSEMDRADDGECEEESGEDDRKIASSLGVCFMGHHLPYQFNSPHAPYHHSRRPWMFEAKRSPTLHRDHRAATASRRRGSVRGAGCIRPAPPHRDRSMGGDSRPR